MNRTEIRKTLYKQKPNAALMYIRKGTAYYETQLETQKIVFEIPVEDMGDADFHPIMEAKLLIRWIQH